MRILFLSYELPTEADNGDRVYTVNILRELVDNGHYVHLVCFESTHEAAKNGNPKKLSDSGASQMQCSCAQRLTSVPFVSKSMYRCFCSPMPGMMAHRFSRRYIRTVIDILGKEPDFDAVIVNHFKMSYIIEAIKSHTGRAAKVIITHNVEAPTTRTIYHNHKHPVYKCAYFIDFLKMKRYEPKCLAQYDMVTAISNTDHDYFVREYGLKNVRILKPGIDVTEYASNYPDPRKDRSVIICGSFYWEAKRSNLLSLLNSPKFGLLGSNGIKLRIVGNAPEAFVEYVRNKYPQVQITGRVPDVRPYYHGCSIALIPEVMGGGFKLKLLEAMALKKAVIGLSNSINESLMEPGTHYYTATDMNDLIIKVVRLMQQPLEVRKLAQNAYRLLESDYTWRDTHDALINAIMTTTGKKAEYKPEKLTGILQGSVS